MESSWTRNQTRVSCIGRWILNTGPTGKPYFLFSHSLFHCGISRCIEYSCLCCTVWPVAHQAPLSMGFSRQEYWSGLPFPSPGDLADPGIEPGSPALQADSLLSEPPGKPTVGHCVYLITVCIWISNSCTQAIVWESLTLNQCMASNRKASPRSGLVTVESGNVAVSLLCTVASASKVALE